MASLIFVRRNHVEIHSPVQVKAKRKWVLHSQCTMDPLPVEKRQNYIKLIKLIWLQIEPKCLQDPIFFPEFWINSNAFNLILSIFTGTILKIRYEWLKITLLSIFLFFLWYNAIFILKLIIQCLGEQFLFPWLFSAYWLA